VKTLQPETGLGEFAGCESEDMVIGYHRYGGDSRLMTHESDEQNTLSRTKPDVSLMFFVNLTCFIQGRSSVVPYESPWALEPSICQGRRAAKMWQSMETSEEHIFLPASFPFNTNNNQPAGSGVFAHPIGGIAGGRADVGLHGGPLWPPDGQHAKARDLVER